MAGADTATRADLAALLAQGRSYFWVLRHAYGEPEDRDVLRAAGLNATAALALKELEPAIARFPHPAAHRADHRYLQVPIPPDMMVYLAPVLTERGVEVGTELFPERTDWTFAHDEIQYCTGGTTPMEAVLPHGAVERKTFGVGDVMAIPAGTRCIFDSTEAGGRSGHAHIYLVLLAEGLPRTFYDAVPFLRLQQRGLLDLPGDAPPLHDLDGSRIDVMDWAELVAPRDGGAWQAPTWLRNGWAQREATRALDYREGSKSLVITAPDRAPENYFAWGEGAARCRVNPLVAEAGAAITDCVFPAGYHRSQPFTEVWTVLRGAARVRQSIPPLHAEEHVADVAGGTTLVVPGGARVFVDDASEDLVVRRLAQSCAHNGHWALMERKLELDGVPADL